MMIPPQPKIRRGPLGLSWMAVLPSIIIIAFLSSCGQDSTQVEPSSPSSPWFHEEALSRNLDFVHESGSQGQYLMPEIMIGGAALIDLEQDGDLDVYLVQGGSLDGDETTSTNRLYRNDGTGHFEDISDGSGADIGGYAMGVATGDYDGDGDTDLYITHVGKNVLLANDGTGSFEDVTAKAGLDDSHWSASAAFFDYDRDGDLDLFVTHYLIWSKNSQQDCRNELGNLDYCSPQSINAPVPDTLYQNDGQGRFRDVTEESGLAEALGTGLDVVCGDFNGDARPDIFVANDGMDDRLWIQQEDQTFVDVALIRGCAVDESGHPKAGMGVSAAYLDDDDRLDLLVGNLGGQTDSLFLNRGSYFADETATRGLAPVSRPLTRFGLAFADFNNDSYLDLFEANGRVAWKEFRFADDVFAEPNALLQGQKSGSLIALEPRASSLEVVPIPHSSPPVEPPHSATSTMTVASIS